MPTKPKQAKRCKKCGLQYIAWRCPRCHRRHSNGSSSRSTFARRGGAASVLSHSWGDLDPMPVNASAAACANIPTPALAGEG